MRRSTRQKLETLALLGTLALSPSCGEDARDLDSPRLVVLYMPCTVRKDFLSPYEESVAFTPNLARFASEGVVFERHESEAGQSGLAFASILTGTQADGHGIYYHPLELHPSSLTVAEAFAAAGYDTWFWSGQPWPPPRSATAREYRPSRPSTA